MELLLQRETRTATSTIGKLTIDGQFECFILEDTDRKLNKDMHLDLIKKVKVYAKTAIPAGRYEIAITWSNRFQQYMPLVMNVPGYEGIRIHWGNTPEATAGCLLAGDTKGKDYIGESKKAYQRLFAKMRAVEKKQKIFITIQ